MNRINKSQSACRMEGEDLRSRHRKVTILELAANLHQEWSIRWGAFVRLPVCLDD